MKEFSSLDLFLSLVCIDANQVSFAILQCTNLKSASQSLDRAPASEISLPDSSYEVSGQILSLEPIFMDPERTKLIWIWDSQFVALEGTKSRSKQALATTVTRVRHLNVTLSGSLILPLLSSEFFTAKISDLPSCPTQLELETTWAIRQDTLLSITQQLNARLTRSDHKASLAKIPLFASAKRAQN